MQRMEGAAQVGFLTRVRKIMAKDRSIAPVVCMVLDRIDDGWIRTEAEEKEVKILCVGVK